MTTRRDFIRQAAILGAGISINPFFIKAGNNQVGANDKIRVGLIGCKGMGYSDLQAFLRNPEVECIALSDIDEKVLNDRATETEKLTGKKLSWDGTSFHDTEADKYLCKEYRAPWELPKI